MRLARIVPGRRPPAGLVGAVLTRDLLVDGERWSKGRRLTAADLVRLAAAGETRAPGGRSAGQVTVIVAEAGDLHEDEAALRLAGAIRGPGLELRGPAESRVDLLAATDGVFRVRVPALERLNRIDPLEVFTVFDGQVVRAGALVASVKVAPHVVAESTVAAGERVALGAGPLVRVAPFARWRVGVVVKEMIGEPARTRFEASIRARIEGLGSSVASFRYVGDDPGAVAEALRTFARGPGRVDLLLTAGAGSTDPLDAVFVALARVGGRIVRHGVPAHPGSMLWLGRIGRTVVLGLPTCGAYSKATAVDLLLPWLLSGEPASAATVARLGHGGILGRDQRFRFLAYALELEAPEG